jgi:replicative DNA helicase
MQKDVRVSPHCEDTEKAVLGNLIGRPSIYNEVSPFLHRDYFYNNINKRLFGVIKEMVKDNEPIDLVTVSAKASICADPLLTSYYISQVYSNGMSSVNYMYYSKKIYELYLLRNVIIKTSAINDLAYANQDVYSMMNDAHTEIGKLIDLKPGVKFDINQYLTKTLESIRDAGINIIKTGFKEIDKLSGGITRGELSIIGGRPGHGKTTMMLNLIKSCMDQGLKVMVFNREMTNIEMLKKLMVLESGKLSYLNVRRGYINDLETAARLDEVKNTIANKYSEDRFAMFDNLSSFEESSKEVKKFKPDVIFDDYIQLISPENSKLERRLQLERLINDYKWLVKSNNCAAILLSQLNRSIETRGDGKPKLSDLAESGAIEQVAENVFFIYYEHKVKMNGKDGENIIELIGSKVRYGVSGTVKLGYWGDRARIYESIEDCRKEMRNG